MLTQRNRARLRVYCALVAAGLSAACGPSGTIGTTDVVFNPQSAHFDADDGTVLTGEAHLVLKTPGTVEGGVSFVASGNILDRDLLTPYETWVDTLSLADGVVAIEARDSDGRLVASLSAIIDNLGPRLDLVRPRGGCFEPGWETTIEASATDEVGVNSAELRVGGELVAAFEGPPFVFTMPAQQARPGEPLSITVAAENERGLIANESFALNVCGL